MKRFFISTIILSFVCLSSQAQQKWTLRQCIDYAVEHNIDIKQQMLQVEGAKIDLNSSKTSRLPNLNAGIDQNFNFGRSQMGDGVYESVNSSNTGFSVSSAMPLFTGFQISNDIKVKEFDLLSATATLERARENMELQVTSFYLEVLFKKELLKVYQEQLGLTSKQLEKTKAMVEAGKVPLSQEYDMLSQQAKDELDITMAKNNLDISLLNLSQILNLQEDEGFDILEPEIGAEQMEENKASVIPAREIYAIALGIKPHVKVAEYNLESTKKSLGVAKSGYFPTLGLNLGYSTSYNNKNIGGLSNQLRNLGREYIGLSLNVPIFNRLHTRNKVRTAKLNIENRELALDNVKLELYKEIQQAHQSATAAVSKFISTEKAYTAAEESFRYAEQRYEIGKSTVFEFNEAQTKLLTSKSEQIQAKYDFIFRAKILDFYRGVEIDIH